MTLNCKIISRLSLLLGFGVASTACATPAYGVPSTDFSTRVTGSVVDAEGKPIAGIKVTPHPNGTASEKDCSATTDADGKYSTPVINLFSIRDFPVTATDTDGDLNGGDFGEQSVTVEISGKDFSGQTYQALGYAEKTADFTLQLNTGQDENER